jgi:xanthine dehydrogenase small subunit
MSSDVRDFISLFINGRPIRVSGDDVFLSLSDFLRKRQRLTGTKVVCAEGDCGSCAAIIGRLDGRGGIRYAAVTSCIQLVLQLDGAHVVSVEGLRDNGSLNPIQEAMVACHGAQCGFCTPGFVVSMYDQLRDGRPADACSVTRGLVGNLCRCTGYDSISRAAMQTDRAALKSLDALYPPGPILAAMNEAVATEVLIWTPTRKFYKPIDVAAACKFRAENPGSIIIAGATDMGVVCNKRMRAIDVALSLGGLAELRGAKRDGDSLYIGAAEPLTSLERLANEHLPELGAFLAWFGSPLIKNAGTLGGNLVTGSPIGDSLPAMMGLGAEIDIAGVAGRRRVPIGSFYTGYRKTVLAEDELVTGVRIPLPQADEMFKLYKVSRRKDLDISSFSAAIWIRQTNGAINDVRLAFGGVGPMVLRMKRSEEVLRGKPPTIERFTEAARLAAADVTPISDVRGSETYRRTLAGNILLKFWEEQYGEQLEPALD